MTIHECKEWLIVFTVSLCSVFLTISLIAQPASSEDISNGFDHFSTGFPLTGPHERVDCESCHQRGIFAGTPRQCQACHSTSGQISATTKPQNHIQSTVTMNINIQN